MKFKYLLGSIEMHCSTEAFEDSPACFICGRFIGTTHGCPACSAYNECITDKLVTDLAAGHICEQHDEDCAKLGRVTRRRRNRLDKRNRRDMTKIHWPPDWRMMRREPNQANICRHCGNNVFNCGCL